MKYTILFFLVTSSLNIGCGLASKRTNWCTVQNLLNDTLLFKEKRKDIFIDQHSCQSFENFSIYLRGRIENSDSLDKNVRILGIHDIDSLNMKIPVSLGPSREVISWFDPSKLTKSNDYYNYFEKIDNKTSKWIFYKDTPSCDTFYVALMSF